MDKKMFMKELFSWFEAILFAVIIFLILNVFIGTATVRGTSMQPNLAEGDFLIMEKMSHKSDKIEYGDIIVFQNEYRGHALIKRVLGVSGDYIEVKEGKVFRNGEVVNEEYLSNEALTMDDISIEVKEGTYFVLGDNRMNSLDSRSPHVGLVDKSIIVGKVFIRLFPNFKFM